MNKEQHWRRNNQLLIRGISKSGWKFLEAAKDKERAPRLIQLLIPINAILIVFVYINGIDTEHFIGRQMVSSHQMPLFTCPPQAINKKQMMTFPP